MQTLEVDLSSFQDAIRDPAVPSYEHGDGLVYFVFEDRVVGIGRCRGGSGTHQIMAVSVVPEDEAAKAFFADDVILQNPVLAPYGLRYHATTGTPTLTFDDEPEGRHKGTYIVSKFLHDQGMLPKRYTVQPLTQESRKLYNKRIDRAYGFTGPKGRDRLFPS